MPTAPIMEPTTEYSENEEILDDPEDREDLIDHLKVMRRIRSGKEKTISWEDVKRMEGL